MNRQATTSVTPSIAARTMYGTPRFGRLGDDAAGHRSDEHRHAADRLGPAEDRLQVAGEPGAPRASTSQASVAPEKNVNPRPSRIEATAQPISGAWTCHITK